MSEGKGGFWTSLPGILTGAAALITALAGAGLIINEAGEGGSSGSAYSPPLDSDAGVMDADTYDTNATDAVVDEAVADNAVATDLADTGTGEVPDVSGNVPATVRPITVENACPKSISLTIVYDSPSGWNSSQNSAWEIAASDVLRLHYQNNLLNARSETVYIYARDQDGGLWAGNETVGGLHSLMRTTMAIDPYGDYRLRLTCSGGM
jgi:hypothetical protein